MLCFSFLWDKNQALYQIKGTSQNVIKEKPLWPFWLVFRILGLSTSLNQPKWKVSMGTAANLFGDFLLLTGDPTQTNTVGV